MSDLGSSSVAAYTLILLQKRWMSGDENACRWWSLLTEVYKLSKEKDKAANITQKPLDNFRIELLLF